MIAWRTSHRHDSREEPEPDKQGSQAHVELAFRDPFSERFTSRLPDVQARVGFVPNG